MKRLLLAMMLAASAAHARVLVVTPRNTASQTEQREARDLVMRLLLGTLDTYNVDYDVIPWSEAKTEFCRTGVHTFYFGSSGAYTKAYDVVVHAGYTTGANTVGGYRPDSLSLVGALPTVPQLFVALPGAAVTPFRNVTSDSGGVTWDGSSSTHHVEVSAELFGHALRWKNANESSAIRTGSGIRGWRAIVAKLVTPVPSLGGGNMCGDCDGPTLYDTTPDSILMWVIENSTFAAGTAKNIYITVFSNVLLGSMDQAEQTCSPDFMMLGLAMADSASGGKVFEDRTKLPLKLAFQVRGGFTRRASNRQGGIDPADSTNFKATIDSLDAFKIPFVVGVNPDSMTGYLQERAWWLRSKYARFAPEIDLSDAGITLSTLVPRAFTAVDSMANRALGRSGRLSRVLIPKDDDWKPGSRNQDSLVAALLNAGCRGLVTTPNSGDAKAFSLGPATYVGDSDYGATGASIGARLKVYATPNYLTYGSAVYDTASPWRTLTPVARMWAGTFTGAFTWTDGDAEFAEPTTMRTRVFTIHANELSGSTTPPKRPGYWQMKWLYNMAKATNILAGRPLIEWTYPDELGDP